MEIHVVPLEQAKAGDLIAVGSCEQSGGTVQLQEANGSGVSGSVGIALAATADSATVNLKANFGSGYQAVVNVPAFVEETDEYGVSLDSMNILSGWSITVLDKPPATGYNLNHPASTDLDGNVLVNLREANNGDGTSSLILELYRPAYDDQPSVLIAIGELNLDATPPLSTAASGRIAITGEPGFEGIGESVYMELPAGETIDSLSCNLTATFATVEDLMRAVEEAGVYASVGISENGTGIEFQSQLAGAHLTVSEDCDF